MTEQLIMEEEMVGLAFVGKWHCNIMTEKGKREEHPTVVEGRDRPDHKEQRELYSMYVL
ncbi:hypothetical protein VR7878_02481 [Vibrio ruber DSM 16370]|uniref:Uncharacterized protein n=1 Tax=Vibrio ruber (strain DSM 16370 / JCM 11486 / BCRC 17186 / CECT 7878 / LMG 23124 / VR1) TaxID=1123498 RepID=A0A1R4LMT9_VIBR1|nr:hypothetical protein VR7878_02481 [Vibrio ruber DSM 16370]